MNDDQVVSKILKLLENNTAFIGYALNGGIGTKINVRNTETGKTIQALSINVDSSGEVLVVKDSNDGKYKAVTFKAAQQTTERIIQIRKTKPIDDKKIIEYTDTDIEVFYLFVKLIDTGSPYPTDLQSTWIRKGSSCTQFVGAYERCNYAARDTINGINYTGLPYVPYPSLQECLNDELGRDARSPHGTGDSNNGGRAGWKYFSTLVTGDNEERMLTALTSHDSEYGTSYKNLFGYGSILDCSGAMNLEGWEVISVRDPATNIIVRSFFRCEFGYLPGYTNACTPAMQAAGYCDSRGFINSKCPLPGQEEPGQPSVGNVQNDWGHTYGWVNLPYDFMYKRHFQQLYSNGSTAPGGFYILEVNDGQVPNNLPPSYFPWTPGCPSGGTGGPYDGSGGGRSPEDSPPVRKRDMKLSTHKAEIWLGSSKKEEAIKLYELGASDLFSGMYNAFILAANESQVDIENRLRRGFTPTTEEEIRHVKFYENRDKNIIDLRIDPRVWIYIINNVPKANYVTPSLNIDFYDPKNSNLQTIIDHLYNRTINLTILNKNTQVVHLKLGLSPSNPLSNTDCKGNINSSFPQPNTDNGLTSGQSWEYRKYITIKVSNWEIESTSNVLDTTLLPDNIWNKEYIERKYFTSFSSLAGNAGAIGTVQNSRDRVHSIILRPNNDVSLLNLLSGENFEQYNYTQAASKENSTSSASSMTYFANNSTSIRRPTNSSDNFRYALKSTSSWWAIWDKTRLDSNNRLSSVVGFDVNYYQIVTSFGLNPNLNYTAQDNNNLLRANSFWAYLSERPKVYIPSNIRSVRNKLISLTTSAFLALSTREGVLNRYGLNYFFSYQATLWPNIFRNRLDGIITPDLPALPPFYESPLLDYTREQYLFDFNRISQSIADSTRIDTRQWFNRLWTQFVYDGSIKVDVDSYKNVEFNHPTNPAQYIKYVPSSGYTNSEFPFALDTVQPLETVLTPGVLDVTKQVPIKKPTNVELDPNMSFLVYLYPFVEVTKKKKEI